MPCVHWTSPYPPRLMKADRAAAYCDLSRAKFLELVDDGILPTCKDVGGVSRWDRLELDAACDAMADRAKKSRRPSLDDLLEAEDGEGDPSLRQ
jgi:hypothetical protein